VLAIFESRYTLPDQLNRICNRTSDPTLWSFIHPAKWGYTTLERQNKLHVYGRLAECTLSDAPIFVKDTLAIQPRTFALDSSGSVLAVANQSSGLVRDGSHVSTMPSRLTLFRIGRDGKLDLAHHYDLATGGSKSLFWVGIISLP
jgi:hypothetical protein